MRIYDTHTHYNFTDFSREVAETTWNNACRLYRDEAATNR